MNRTELVEQVTELTGLEKRQAEAAVMAVIDAVVGQTKAGNKVSIFGFGTFTPSTRAARSGRNPRTGAAVKIAARNVVKFKPATAYNEALNTRKRAAAKKSAPAKSAPAKATAAAKTAAAANADAVVKAAAAVKAVAKKATTTTTRKVAAAKAPAKTAGRAAKTPAKSTTRATKAAKATKA